MDGAGSEEVDGSYALANLDVAPYTTYCKNGKWKSKDAVFTLKFCSAYTVGKERPEIWILEAMLVETGERAQIYYAYPLSATRTFFPRRTVFPPAFSWWSSSDRNFGVFHGSEPSPTLAYECSDED